MSSLQLVHISYSGLVQISDLDSTRCFCTGGATAMLTMQLVQLFRVIVGRQAEDGATDELWYNTFSRDESIRETALLLTTCSLVLTKSKEREMARPLLNYLLWNSCVVHLGGSSSSKTMVCLLSTYTSIFANVLHHFRQQRIYCFGWVRSAILLIYVLRRNTMRATSRGLKG